jgi:hypothetical protein
MEGMVFSAFQYSRVFAGYSVLLITLFITASDAISRTVAHHRRSFTRAQLAAETSSAENPLGSLLTLATTDNRRLESKETFI